MTLSEIYNADRFTTDPVCQDLREKVLIPHPLRGVQYADGFHYASRANSPVGVRP